MYTVDQLLADHDLIKRLVEEHQILKETIEYSPVQFAVYDPEDRLFAWNDAYEAMHKQAFEENRERADQLKLTYPEIIRYQMDASLPRDQREADLEKRVQMQRNADGTPIIRQYVTGEYLKILKYKLPSGAVAGFAFDVSDLKAREAELSEAKLKAESAERTSKVALENEKMLQGRSRLLSELDEWLQCCKSLEELYEIVGAFMAKLLPETSGELYIYSNSRHVLEGACSWNCKGALEQIEPDACWALRRGRAYQFGRGSIAFPCGHIKEQQTQISPDLSYLCLPIVAHGDTVGMLHVKVLEAEQCAQSSDMLRRRYPDMYEFTVQCAEHISLAIANVKLRDELRDQSIRDPLTGLYNRRYFLDMLRNEVSRAEKKRDQIGLISFDADKFKSFNDNHGHDAGDIVLQAIGETIRTTFANGEVACRLGGEEFSIMLPSASMEKTKWEAERLRANIESLHIRYENNELPPVTISAGVAVFPDNGRLASELLKAADVALYVAKGRGRNCVSEGLAA